MPYLIVCLNIEINYILKDFGGSFGIGACPFDFTVIYSIILCVSTQKSHCVQLGLLVDCTVISSLVILLDPVFLRHFSFFLFRFGSGLLHLYPGLSRVNFLRHVHFKI